VSSWGRLLRAFEMLRYLCTSILAVLSLVACASESDHPSKPSAAGGEIDGGPIAEPPPRASGAPDAPLLPASADDENEIPCEPRAILATICSSVMPDRGPFTGLRFRSFAALTSSRNAAGRSFASS